jgi:hypothetical protein
MTNDDVWVPPVGARVRRIGQTFGGIVKAIGEQDGRLMVQVHWGTTTAAEGRPGIPVLEWWPHDDLEPSPHTVVSADEIAERVKAERLREISGS